MKQGAKQNVEIPGAIMSLEKLVICLHFLHLAFGIPYSICCPLISAVIPLSWSALLLHDLLLSAQPSTLVFVLESSPFMLIQLVISCNLAASIILITSKFVCQAKVCLSTTIFNYLLHNCM